MTRRARLAASCAFCRGPHMGAYAVTSCRGDLADAKCPGGAGRWRYVRGAVRLYARPVTRDASSRERTSGGSRGTGSARSSRLAAMTSRRSSFRGWVMWAFALTEVLFGNAIVWTLILAT